MLVRFNGVSRSFGALDVLRNVSFEIHPEEKVGLIGTNGAGKTTILELVRHPEHADAGAVERRSKLRIGHLDQIPDFGRETVLGEALASFKHLRTIEERLRELEAGMADRQDPALLDEYSALLDRFELHGGYSYTARTEAALFGVGFDQSQLSRPAASLSGGEQNRLALVRLLLSDVDLLLLDEPTNHLDIRSIAWLEGFLSTTKKAVLVVSHDRFFLDRTVTRILEVDSGGVSTFSGGYSVYLAERAERRKVQERAWRRQQDWIERNEEFIRRNIAGQKTRQAQSRRKALARLERVERPGSEPARPRFRFAPAALTGRSVVSARGLGVGYGTEPILRNVDLQVERGERWALVGPNGSGKTTLLKSLIGRLDPLEGNVVLDQRARPGYYDQQLDDLDPDATVLEELRSLDSKSTDQGLRSFLARFLFRGEAVSKRVRNLSGGERSRLTLAKIIYTQPPLLALDEPTNHLDIPSREALELALSDYPATLLFVTHDRRLVEKLATRILYLGSGSVRMFERFDQFEEWLDRDVETAVPPPSAPRAGAGRLPGEAGKNRRQAAQRKIARIEAQIKAGEREMLEIETLFQSPPADFVWESNQRRHAQLQESVEALYQELAELES